MFELHCIWHLLILINNFLHSTGIFFPFIGNFEIEEENHQHSASFNSFERKTSICSS